MLTATKTTELCNGNTPESFFESTLETQVKTRVLVVFGHRNDPDVEMSLKFTLDGQFNFSRAMEEAWALRPDARWGVFEVINLDMPPIDGSCITKAF